MSIKSKMMLMLGLMLVVTFSIIAGISMNRFETVLSAESESKAFQLGDSIKVQLQTELTSTLLAVRAIADNPDIQAAFAAGDREELLILLTPVYASVKKEVAQFQFHLPDSTSFLRLHMPEKFGDSLKSFRFTVNEANEKKIAVTGIEEGVGGYGLRVVVPMFHLGIHIGSVEYGNDFGQAYVEKLKTQYGNDVFLYRYNASDPIAMPSEETRLGATMENDSYRISASSLALIAEGTPQYLLAEGDKDVGLLLLPLKDFQGNVTSYAKIVLDISQATAAIRETLSLQILIFGISLLLALALVYVILHISLEPVQRIIMVMKLVSAGDLSVTCTIRSRDELGRLSVSFNDMLVKIRGMIGQVSQLSARISQAMTQITHTAGRMHEGNLQVTQAAQEIARGATDQANDAERTLHATTTLAEKVDEIRAIMRLSEESAVNMLHQTQSGRISAEQLATSLEQTAQSVHDVTSQVRDLTEKSNTIGSITDTITTIAAQTNLLALNAAIEAARAGEHGRGFAVVADEVRNLSEQSATAAKDIQHLVGQITSLIHDTDRLIAIADDQSRASHQNVEKNRVAFSSIEVVSKSVEEDLSRQLLLMDDVNAMKEQVLSSVENISSVTEESAATSEEVSSIAVSESEEVSRIVSAIADLDGVLKQLSDSISHFKVI